MYVYIYIYIYITLTPNSQHKPAGGRLPSSAAMKPKPFSCIKLKLYTRTFVYSFCGGILVPIGFNNCFGCAFRDQHLVKHSCKHWMRTLHPEEHTCTNTGLQHPEVSWGWEPKYDKIRKHHTDSFRIFNAWSHVWSICQAKLRPYFSVHVSFHIFLYFSEMSFRIFPYCPSVRFRHPFMNVCTH